MSDADPVVPSAEPSPGVAPDALPDAVPDAVPEPAPSRWWTVAAVAGLVCWRCAVILSVLAVPLTVVGLATGGDENTVSVVALVWVVHLLVLTLVGYPMGLVLARFVPLTTGRGAAAGWYALAGALPGLLLLRPFGVAALIWVGLGAAVAGAARAWAHRALLTRHGG